MSNSPFLSSCASNQIRDAAIALKAGHLVAFPTETVYGLGADARNPVAVKRIYEVKGRPSDHPLIIHISSINQMQKWTSEVPDYAISLARTFWPGPLTLILKRSDLVQDFISGGQDTVGLRVPSDSVALALISEFESISDSAIAAPSANRFGQVSPTSSQDVQDELGLYLSNVDSILDGGTSRIGIESTIVDCTNQHPIILRSGFITKEDIESTLGIDEVQLKSTSAIKFSGSFEKHYAPKCRVILESLEGENSGFFALSDIPTPPGMTRLGSPSSVDEFARRLYSTFRIADHQGFKILVVIPPKGSGLSRAINVRLEKAPRGR